MVRLFLFSLALIFSSCQNKSNSILNIKNILGGKKFDRVHFFKLTEEASKKIFDCDLKFPEQNDVEKYVQLTKKELEQLEQTFASFDNDISFDCFFTTHYLVFSNESKPIAKIVMGQTCRNFYLCKSGDNDPYLAVNFSRFIEFVEHMNMSFPGPNGKNVSN